MQRFRLVPVLCLSILFACPLLPATGEEPPSASPGPLTLDQAITRTLAGRPGLLAIPHEERAARALVHQAGRPANPRLFSEWENFSGTGDLSGTGAMETTFGLTQEIPLGGKLRHREALARNECQATHLGGQHKRLTMQAMAVTRFVRAFFLQQACRLEEENLALVEKTTDAIARRVAAGEVLPLQKTKAEVELAASRAALERLRRDLEGARAQLVSMWGGAAADLGPLVMADAGTLPPIPDAEEAWQSVASHPAIALADNSVDGARLGLRAARAEAAPDLEITAGWRRFRETGDRAALAGFALTLPLFDRQRGEIRAKQERLAAAELQARDARLEVREQILAALERLQGLRRGIDLHRETILPGAEENFTATERGYRLGELTLLDLFDAQRTLLAARRTTLDMQAEAWQIFAELEFWMPGLTGKRGAP